jgi:hypothetical protein
MQECKNAIAFPECNFEFPECNLFELGNVVLLCGERRVKTIVFTSGDGKITSGEGHKWFLESPQVKIMFLLS